MRDKECREVLYKLVNLLEKYKVFVDEDETFDDINFRHGVQDIVKDWRKGGYHF